MNTERTTVELKQDFCDAFCKLINEHTREHLYKLEYVLHDDYEEEVIIYFTPHYKVSVNVNMDSRFAMIIDIMKRLEHEF